MSMPLARASCGGWWADKFTCCFLKTDLAGNSMPRFPATQKVFWAAAAGQIAAPTVDRPTATVSYDDKTTGISPRRRCGRTPMADKSNDPAVLWLDMCGELEKGFNSFANQAMASPEFSRAMHQAGGVASGAQKQLGELMEKYLL